MFFLRKEGGGVRRGGDRAQDTPKIVTDVLILSTDPGADKLL